MRSLLLRIARAALANVLSKLTGQFQVIQDLAMNPIRTIVQQVVGGAWTGAGADAFVEEVSTLMIPNVTRVGETVMSLNTNLQQAQQIIDDADESSERLIRSTVAVVGLCGKDNTMTRGLG